MASLGELRIAGEDDSAGQETCLLDLPNEILAQVLDHFQTQPLLQHRAVSHRFQNLIIHIVHSRLLCAASLEDRKLILECYHPSAQYTEPYLYCDYLGTPGLSDDAKGQGPIYDIANDFASDGALPKLYSHFRPTRKDSDAFTIRSHPAGDIPGSRTSEAAASRRQTREVEIVKQTVSLEAHELFSQLCFSAGLVQIGPRRGVFLSNVDAVEKKTFRIWRHWLAEMAKHTEDETVVDSLTFDFKSVDGPGNRNESLDHVVWVDQNKIAGLKVRVKERKWRRDTPILILKDEDQAVSYSLELEELVISTTHLMLAVERSLLNTIDSRRAMVFGSFPTVQNGQQSEDNTTS